MIKLGELLKIKQIILLYLVIFSGKLKLKYLSNLNFRILDFNNYSKNKNLIFKKDFFKMEKNPIIYNYDFISLCNEIGGKRGIELAKIGVIGWYEINRFKPKLVWDTEQIANRILNLVYNFDFINSISTKSEEDKLKKILKVNINAFNRFSFSKNINRYNLNELKVFILIKYILGEQIVNINNKFEIILANQVDSFSVHKSYNFFEHAKFINNINEIILMLLNFKYEVPDIFNLTKIKMEAVLAQYFHKDGTVALFNGTSNTNLEKIKLGLKNKQNLRKISFANNSSGIFYLEDKDKKIFIDAVQPTNLSTSKELSAGTLSIEFSANKEKIITNCGALEKSKGNAAYLRYSAAHSTIILENTNISEIRDNQPHIKYPQMVSFKRNQAGQKHEIEVSHNGYIKNFKKIVKRKIYFEEGKNHLNGEDSIISSTSKNKEIIYHIRFHIMPNINITQTNSRKNIILKTKSNIIWVFESNKDLTVEESVYIDQNNAKETKQIVIKGITKKSREKIQWSISKK